MIDELTSNPAAFWSSLSALLMTSLALMGSPGPATISVTAMAAAFGPRRAAPYLLGIIAGTTTVLVIVASGLTGAVLALPGVGPVLIAAAAVYILYLAFTIATAPPLALRDSGATPSSFVGGLFLALANPKAYAAIAAVFASVSLVPRGIAWDAGLKVAVLAIMVALINTAWLFVGAGLSRMLSDPIKARIVNVLFATALVVAVVLAVAV